MARQSDGEYGLGDYSTRWLWFYFVAIQFVWGWFAPLLMVAGVVLHWEARAAEGRLPSRGELWIPFAFWALAGLLALRIACVLRVRGAARWRFLGVIVVATASVAGVVAFSLASLP